MRLIALCLLAMSLALSSADAQPKGNPGKGPKKDVPAVQNNNSSVVDDLTDTIFGDDDENGQKASKGKNKGRNSNQQGLADGLLGNLFGDNERNIISNYFRNNNVATSSLPPGIAKRYLPSDLLSTLPAAPGGYERLIIDGKVLLVEIATQIIHDVLTDAILK